MKVSQTILVGAAKMPRRSPGYFSVGQGGSVLWWVQASWAGDWPGLVQGWGNCGSPSGPGSAGWAELRPVGPGPEEGWE